MWLSAAVSLFLTRRTGEVAETWVVARYEPARRIAFARFGGDVVTRLDIELAESQGRTRAIWTTSQVGTSETGNARVEAVTEEAHTASRAGLEVMLQHYLATGELIDTETLHKRLELPAHG